MLAAAAAGSQGRMLAGAAIAWGIASAFSAGRKSDQGDRFGVEKREAQEQRSLLENALRARRFLVQDVEARSRAGVGGGRGRGWGRGREHEAMVERDREQIKSLSFLIGIGVVQESLSFVGRAAFALLTLFQRKGDEDEAALD